jgi:hypothetical protein
MQSARSLIPLFCLGGANLNCKKFCEIRQISRKSSTYRVRSTSYAVELSRNSSNRSSSYRVKITYKILSFRYCQQICSSYRNIRITEGSSYGSSTVFDTIIKSFDPNVALLHTFTKEEKMAFLKIKFPLALNLKKISH